MGLKVRRRLLGRLRLPMDAVRNILLGRSLSEYPADLVSRVRKLFAASPPAPHEIAYFHLRRHPRRTMRVRARLQVFLEDGTLFDEGPVLIEDMSPGGARLARFKSRAGALPLKPHRLVLCVNDVPIPARPVRVASAPRLEIAVAFVRPDAKARACIKALLESGM